MKKQFSRIILMIAGISTVVVILLSQSFYAPSKTSTAKARTEQKANHHPHADITHAPPDVVPSSTVQLNENTPTPLKTLTLDEEREKISFPDVKIIASYFKTLFRAIISPNAP